MRPKDTFIRLKIDHRPLPVGLPGQLPEKVNPTLPAGIVRVLEALAQVGLYGNTKTEVAGYLIIKAVDDLWKDGRVSLPPINPAAATPPSDMPSR